MSITKLLEAAITKRIDGVVLLTKDSYSASIVKLRMLLLTIFVAFQDPQMLSFAYVLAFIKKSKCCFLQYS